MKVLSFGMLSEITGADFSVEAEDTESLKSELFARFPKLTEKKFAIAINKQLVHEPTKLSQTDEIALMPPYSGG